jgi:hypothetical protein
MSVLVSKEDLAHSLPQIVCVARRELINYNIESKTNFTFQYGRGWGRLDPKYVGIVDGQYDGRKVVFSEFSPYNNN